MFHTYSKILVIAGIVFCLFSPVFAYSGGNGEPNDPYQIATVSDWQQLMYTSSHWNKNFILTNDVNLQGVYLIPIGNSGAFGGVFDGNGHTISNAAINRPGFGNSGIGLFHDVNSGGQIRNLGVVDVNIMGYGGVGGLAGYNRGSIIECYSTGFVRNDSGFLAQDAGGLAGNNDRGNISNCYSNANVSGSSNIGGLVGNNYEGSIINCYSTGSVSGSSGIGGLAGYNSGGISNCYSTGAVNGTEYSIGGLVGYNNSGYIANSFWDVDTSGQTSSDGGEGKTTAEMKTLSTFTSASWDFINETANGTCNYWQMPTGCYPVLSLFNGYIPSKPSGSGTENDPYVITNANELGTIWYRSKAHYALANNVDLAGIKWSSAVVPEFSGGFDGNGFCVKNLLINDGGFFLGLFGRVNNDGGVKNLGVEDCNINGATFEEINGYPGSYYVGGLAGENVNGSITKCYTTGFIRGGVFVGGVIGYNSYSLFNNCCSAAIVSGNYDVGGLAGQNYYGNIDNCHAVGEVNSHSYAGGLVGESYHGNINNCYSKGIVNGYSWTGGLLGENDEGNTINCYSICNVSGAGDTGGLVGEIINANIINCYSIGEVNGAERASGLVGTAQGQSNIYNCYSAYAVRGTSCVGGLLGTNLGCNIYNCYSTGDVNGSSYIGGLVGYNNEGGSISNSYSRGAVSGSEYAGGFVGYNIRTIISECYSTGAVSGLYSGGFFGYNYEGDAISCFWDVNTSGLTYGVGNLYPSPAGLTGKTTQEMKTLSTYTNAGWDFSYNDGDEADWFMQIDEYPILVWQISPADIYTDGKNNFRDFAIFAQYWMREDCRVYNDYCDWSDLNFDGSVDYDDLIVLMSYWLESGIYE